MASSRGDGAVRRSSLPVTTRSSLLEIVTDAVAMTNLQRTASLMSDDGSDDSDSCSFPMLRRIGSFPILQSAAPPRRPSRSTSLERSLHLDSDEDMEIDHEKFRQLLLGKSVGDDETDHDQEEEEQVDLEDCAATNDAESGGVIKLKARKSSSSAPPKIPNRVGSDSERIARTTAAATTLRQPRTPPSLTRIHPRSGRKQHRQSLPSSAFRPQPVHRRRRQRSFIQETLTPNSETSSKSLRMPPKLPNRTESEESMGGGRARSIPTSVFCSTGSASAASSSQKSNTSATDAPKRPRRSLSPIFGESLRSLMDPNLENTAAAIAKTEELSQKIEVTPRRKRKTPTRAKTFSFYQSYQQQQQQCHSNSSPKSVPSMLTASTTNSCIAMLTKNWDLGRNFEGTPVTNTNNGDNVDVEEDAATALWTATTWPKPRRTKVPPGRSRTFSFFVKPQSLASRGVELQSSDGSGSNAAVVGRCA